MIDCESGDAIVSTHSRLKAAGYKRSMLDAVVLVSTHSRLKAAGLMRLMICFVCISFNTQPPEGGWVL